MKRLILVLAVLWPLSLLGGCQAGVDAAKRGDYAAAYRERLPLAEQGDADAQYNLGVMYDTGSGVSQDYVEAVKWYRLAAEQGHAGAQTLLGFKYENRYGLTYGYGSGVSQDYVEAVKWYRLAAEQGFPGAQTELGRMYYTGRGVPEDYAEALKWYRLAAEQGNAEAQYNLGASYWSGKGVAQDYVEAFAWLNLAAAQGQTGAAWNRGIVLERMTPAQVDQAQQLSRTLAQRIENRAKAGVPASPAQSDGSALERNYPQGTVMVRIDIRDAKITDFVNPRKFAAGYLGTLANLQGADWSYYEGSSLVRHCVEKSGSLNEECRNSLDLELASLDFTIGVDCTKAQGLRTRKDMQSLLQRFVRESPTEARESGELIGATAFLKYADPRLCPESATAAAARAEREERATRAAGGDAEDQYQLALRKFGEERAHWLCLATNEGHAAAQYEYGMYFETYEGDTVTAYRWHLLSKRGGYWQAPEAVSRLEGSLSSAEVAQTKSIVEHWKRDECP